MRIVDWLVVVSMALFVGGIGFIVAAARTNRQVQTATPSAPAVTPVASVRQIMRGIVGPSADAIYNAVSTTVSAKGVEEKAPSTDEEWEALGNSAAAIVESGNLMLMEGRLVDQQEWVKQTRAMMDGAKLALKAAREKKPEDIFAAGDPLNKSCDDCHRIYTRGS